MATTQPAEQLIHSGTQRRAIAGVPADSVRLDWTIAIFACINVCGLFIDGWAHNHGKVDDTFFTPWHAVLYGAIFAAGLLLIVTHFRNVGRGYRWSQALPTGYALSLLGFFTFMLGGVGDLLWHETFGFERGLEALLSPSHLFLALSAVLIMTGPIRSMWGRESDNSWRSLLPAILSFTCITCIFTFFTTFAAVTSEMIAMTGSAPSSKTLHDIYGIVSLLVHPNILLAVVLFMARRWRLPFGTVTLIFTVNALLMTWMHIGETGEFILAISAAAVGLLGDWLLRQNALDSAGRLRFFAFIMPFAYSLGALMMLQILGTSVWGRGGLWWEIHMWLGVPVLAGAFGYGLSLLMRPPAASAKVDLGSLAE